MSLYPSARSSSRVAHAGQPAAEVVRSPGWIVVLLVLAAPLAFIYADLFARLFTNWMKPDYSHGFLVPIFSAYLAWHFRDRAPDRIKWPAPWGLAFLAVGYGLFKVADRTNIGQDWLQGFSLVVCLCGVVLLLGGWKSLRWLAPSLAFLLFMLPLPWSVEHALGWHLQKVAAVASEFVLQTIGYATYREGIILHVKEHSLLVAEACSGLSMLLTFLALSAGMAILVNRPWLDRALILVSAIPVAVVSNVIRIALTGVLYNEAGKELGDRVFHDFAGWMMMPIALAILWGELKLLDWVWVDSGGKASGREMMRVGENVPGHLIMTALPPEKGGAAAPKPMPTKGAPR